MDREPPSPPPPSADAEGEGSGGSAAPPRPVIGRITRELPPLRDEDDLGDDPRHDPRDDPRHDLGDDPRHDLRDDLRGPTQDFPPIAAAGGPSTLDDSQVPAHRAVTLLARPGSGGQGNGPPPVAEAARFVQGDTVSERELPPARAARGSTTPAPAAPPGGSGPVARYLARGELGRGGMGRVLEALDRRLGRVVAIKESFATDPDGQQRFEREVAITARLEHPAIVPLYDSGVTADGRAFYVMRKLSGRGLDVVMSELKSLDERLALLPALLSACDAVAHAHARRVVHRDLKPGNILIGDHGETLVIDWGLAKAMGDSEPPPRAASSVQLASEGAADKPGKSGDSAKPAKPLTAPGMGIAAPLPIPGAGIPGIAGSGSRPVAAPLPPDDLKTVVGSVFGTPGFMSPEQARGEQLDMRGDVYALGATLYHVLAGRPPHIGRSATEVIDRVRVEPPPPLAQVCPGAPIELVAIVEKAMAFDIEARYPEAAELAGDLRRFLAGQLVAAHRYTFWQRLRRASRAHRAAFLVAGASLLVVSALASISILRIISERDQARAARQLAQQETKLAKAARAVADARADELIVAQAHSLVAENPTAALGLLKRLPESSPSWPKARMVAMGAVAEGVTRALPHGVHRPPSIFAMSPRGDVVLVGEDQGQVWTLDLESLRRKDVVDLGSRVIGCWVDGGASAVLASEAVGLVIRDLSSGRTRTVPIPSPVSDVSCHPTGLVAFIDKAGALSLLDPALAQVRKVDLGAPAESVEITPDGAWIVTGGTKEAVVLDRDGAVRRRFPGEVLRLLTSPKSKIAIMYRDHAVELDPALAFAAPPASAVAPASSSTGPFAPAAPPPVPTPSNLSGAPPPPRTPPPPAVTEIRFRGLTLAIYFVGERLRFMQAGNRLFWADGSLDVELPSTPLGFTSLGDRTTAFGLSDGSLWLSGWWGARLLHTPSTNPILRLAGHPGSARLAGWSRGNIFVWNLGGAIPRSLPADNSVSRVVFLGEHRLAAIGMSSWYWIDLQRGTTEHLEPRNDLPMFNDLVVDVDRGDVLLLDTMMGGAALMRWSERAVVGSWRDHVRSAALLGDGAVAIGTGDGRIAVGRATEKLKILEMENAVIGLSRLGAHGLIAIDSEGELLAYDLPSGAITKGALGEPPSGIIVDDGAGGAIIAAGARLLRWTGGQKGGLSELARVAEPILRLTRFRNHLAILTASELSTLDLDSAERPPPVQRIASTAREQQLSDGSRWAIGLGQRGLIDLVDIATGVRWSKSIHGGLAMFGVSPAGSRVAQLLYGEIALWSYDVPENPAELRAWLDETTNATVSDTLDVLWTRP